MSALTLPAFLCLFTALLLALHPVSRYYSMAAALPGIALGWAADLLQWPAIATIAVLASLLCLCERSHGWQRKLILATLALLALAAALHLLPGFTPVLWQNDFGRDGALPLRWHFDKGLAGLLLLYALRPNWIVADRRRWGLLFPVSAALILLAILCRQASFDPRWLPGTLIWLAGNLFLTVIAEEAFFRGLIQAGLQKTIHHPHAFLIASSLTALLFAAVHLPWGWPFALGALLAGLFYGWMAGPEMSLQRAIAAHFSLNALLLVITRSPLG